MTKMELSPEQREELLQTLKARFEKNMNRHPGLEWADVQAKLEENPEKLWSLHEMEETGESRMSLVTTARQASTYSMIVRLKVQKAAGASAMTAKRWSQGKNINRKAVPSKWQLPWALSC